MNYESIASQIRELAGRDNLTEDEAAKLDDLIAKGDQLRKQADALDRFAAPADAGDEVTKGTELDRVVEAVLNHIETSPRVKSAGFVSQDGGNADQHVKSLGDYLIAIRRGDVKRLRELYGAVKDMESDDGSAGGYLVPEEYVNRFMQIADSMSVVRSRATVIPVSSDHGRMPALDQGTAPTAGSGQTAFAGGVVASWAQPGAALTETQPRFASIEYQIKKLAGYTEVDNELNMDSPQAIEVLLSRLFGVAVASMEDHAFLRGTGASEPLGILNSAAAIGVAPASNNVFAYADALSMRSRFKAAAGGDPVWLIHPGIWPDVGAFEVSSGSGGVFQANLGERLGERLLGYSILESEHLPQDDNAGAVILADLSAYVIFDRSQMSIAFSEHAGFTSDKATWRFTKRLDGMPWLDAAITLADPQGSYTVSPFVYHND